MRLLLLRPSGSIEHLKFLQRIGYIYELNLPVIASLTPKDWDINIIDERLNPVPNFDGFDLIGISVQTHNSSRAYCLADQCKRKRIPVVLGGIHVNLIPQEAMAHADSIIIGAGETSWPQLLRDFQHGRLKKIYANNDLTSNHLNIIPRRDLIEKKTLLNIHSVSLFRGCHNVCRFCVVKNAYSKNGKVISKDPEFAIKEIRSIAGKNLCFLDDNLMTNPNFLKTVLKGIKDLKKRWVGQITANVIEDEELLRLLQQSGCKMLFIGFDTVKRDNLKYCRKEFNPQYYNTVVAKLHSYGISIFGSFIFGFPYDDKSIFKETVETAIESKMDLAAFNIYTPLPGTPDFSLYDKQERILTKDWRKYDFKHVVFDHEKMSPEEIEGGYFGAIKRFYSVPSILSRFNALRNKWLTLPINFAYNYWIARLLRKDEWTRRAAQKYSYSTVEDLRNNVFLYASKPVKRFDVTPSPSGF